MEQHHFIIPFDHRLRDYIHRLRDLGDLESPDAVHDFRVATRRLEEILYLLDTVEPERPDVTNLLQAARPAARALSPLRTRDVCLQLVQDLEDSVPHHDYLVHWGIAAFRPRLLKTRARAAARARDNLSAERRAQLEHAARRLVSTPWRVPAQQLERARRRLVSRNLQRVSAHLHALADDDPQDKDLHTLRLAFKALRYAFELIPADDVGGPVEHKRRLKLLKQFQNALGSHRDWRALGRLVARRRRKAETRGKDRNQVAGLEALEIVALRRADSVLAGARALLPDFEPESF